MSHVPNLPLFPSAVCASSSTAPPQCWPLPARPAMHSADGWTEPKLTSVRSPRPAGMYFTAGQPDFAGGPPCFDLQCIACLTAWGWKMKLRTPPPPLAPAVQGSCAVYIHLPTRTPPPPGRCFNFHSGRGGPLPLGPPPSLPWTPTPPPPSTLIHLRIRVLGTFFRLGQFCPPTVRAQCMDPKR